MSEQSKLQVKVYGASESATRMEVSSGKFKLVIDEPESMGGTDAGPTPVQVLLMGLAGCLNVTGHLIAQQQGLVLRGMQIKITGDLNPNAFLGRSFEARAGFERIEVTITADALDATEEVLRVWIEEIERRCPVTDNLRAETEMVVTVKRA